MSNNTTLPGTGEVVEDIDIGAGVKRQIISISDRAGNAVDSIGGLTETAPASDTASSGLNGRLQRIAQNIATLIAALTGTAAKGLYNKCFSAAFTTLTRPANVTAYTAGDAISNNATAGSVTALSATVADANDNPVFIADLLIVSTDTGIAGKKLRANLFNSDPTASTGVGGGDNAAYSQKKAGYIGTFVGTMESGFSDGCVGRMVPSFRDTAYTPAGGFVIALPSSGGVTLYVQLVAEEVFTPSANSTTFIVTARGWQARPN